MANVREQIVIAQAQAQEIIADHKEKIQVEENLLINAKMDLPMLEYLKLESEIEAKRAVRENNVKKIKALVEQLNNEFKDYIAQLKTRSDATEKKRYQLVVNFVDKVSNKSRNSDARGAFLKSLQTNHYIIGSHIFITDSNGKSDWLYNHAKTDVARWKQQGYAYLGRKHIYTGSYWPYMKQYVYAYGVPKHVLINRIWDRVSKVTPKTTIIKHTTKHLTYGDRLDLEKTMEAMFLCFPSVKDWEANPSGYPFFIGFAEEFPIPSTKQIDKAIKMVMKYGSKEYGEESIEFLKEIAEFNTQDNLEFRKEYELRNLDYLDQGGLAPIMERKSDPKANPVFNWYRPRPAPYHVYVPGMDYINPSTYINEWNNPSQKRTAYGDYMRDVRRAEMRARWQQNLNTLKTFINPLAGGPLCAIDPNSQACKLYMDGLSFSIGAAKVWLAAAIGYITGGTGASVAGAATALIQDPNLGMNEGDLGRILVKLAEAYAIARITDAPINKAIQEVIENEIYAIAKRELGKQTGLDKTLLGRVAVDLTAGTAFGMYKDKDFVDAITGSADKSWRMAVARENPYGAILMAGVTEIEKNGWSINSTNPMDWFDNINLGDEFQRIRHSIRGKDLAKMIGLTYMVSAGKISEGDALLLIGQEASKRNIERFYQDKPLQEDPEMSAYYEKQREVGRWKQGIAVMQKLSTGVPPTKEDILIISDNVAGPIYDRIKSLGLPTKYEVNLWDIAINEVGLPNIAVATPDMSFDLPEWMRSKQSDGHVVITNKEQMEEYLGKKFTKDTELTKEDIVEIILGMFPRNVPLIPVSKEPMAPTFNWIDNLGNLKIRDPLKFPYDHPMLKSGNIPKKYTKKQLEYMKAREAEMLQAKAEMARLTKQLEELQSQTNIG